MRYLVLTWVEKNCAQFTECIEYTLRVLRHNTGFSQAESLFAHLMRNSSGAEYIGCIMPIEIEDLSQNSRVIALRDWEAPDGFRYQIHELADNADHEEVAREKLQEIDMEVIGPRPSLHTCGLPYQICIDNGLTTGIV